MALQGVKVSCETVNWRKVTNEGQRRMEESYWKSSLDSAAPENEDRSAIARQGIRLVLGIQILKTHTHTHKPTTVPKNLSASQEKAQCRLYPSILTKTF